MDSPVGGAGDDTINAISSTLTTGDLIRGGAGNDTLALTLDGNTGTADMTGVETVSVRLLSSSTVNQTLMTGVTTMSVGSSSITGTDLTVTGGDLATTYEVASGKVNGLTVTYLDATGTADTAKLSLKGVGSSTADAAVSVSSSNSVEAVTISATGKNYVDLTAGTGAKSITITGDGSNYIDIVSSATSTTVDASAATGLLDLDIGSGLTTGDVLKAGAGTTDKLTATVASTAVNAPTISGFETLALTLSAAVNLDLANVTGAKTITLADSAANQRLSNVAASVTSISLQEATTSGTVRVDYASGADATLALNFAPTATATGNVTYGDVTLSNVANLTVSASGAYKSTIGDVALGTALTDLTLKTTSATGDLATGNLTGRSLETITISAASGDVTVADIVNDVYGTVKSLSINASGKAAVTITGGLDFYESVEDTSSLETISIVGEAGSVISLANGIAAAGAATDTGPDVAITIELGEDSGGSDIGAIDAVGVASVNIAIAENAGIASEVGLITAKAGNVGDVTVTVNDDAALEFNGVTADEGDIGDVTITTVGDATVNDDGAASTDITATKGNIGDITLTSGNGGVIKFAASAAAGNIGNVSVTSNANDTVSIAAEDDIGNVTMTVAAGDALSATIDASTIGNISITGAGKGSVTVRSSDAGGAATATTGNITVSLSDLAAAGSSVDLSDVTSAGTVSVTGGAGVDVLTAARAEVFTITFSGTVAGAGETVIFDGTTIAYTDGTPTAAELAAAVANGSFANWTASASGATVTFTAKGAGAKTDVTSASFTGTQTATKAVEVTTQGNSITAVTFTGGAGADDLFGGDGVDTLNGGSGADEIYGRAGGDSINVGASSSDADIVYYDAIGHTLSQTSVFSTFAAATSVASADKLSGMGNGDKLDLTGAFDVVVDAGNGNAEYTVSAGTTALAAITASGYKLVSGKYDAAADTFIAGASSTENNDYIFQWADGTRVNTVVLVDVWTSGATVSMVGAAAADQFTLTIA